MPFRLPAPPPLPRRTQPAGLPGRNGVAPAGGAQGDPSCVWVFVMHIHASLLKQRRAEEDRLNKDNLHDGRASVSCDPPSLPGSPRRIPDLLPKTGGGAAAGAAGPSCRRRLAGARPLCLIRAAALLCDTSSRCWPILWCNPAAAALTGGHASASKDRKPSSLIGISRPALVAGMFTCSSPCIPTAGLPEGQLCGSGLFQVFVPEGGPFSPPSLREKAAQHRPFAARVALPGSGAWAEALFRRGLGSGAFVQGWPASRASGCEGSACFKIRSYGSHLPDLADMPAPVPAPALQPCH